MRKRGRDSEARGRILDPVTAFVERQKSHREADAEAIRFYWGKAEFQCQKLDRGSGG